MPTEPPAAGCTDLVQVYAAAAGGVAALRGVDASFSAGTLTAVVGPSGAGKSTFLRLLACLERPAAGEVTIGDQATSHLSTRARRRLVSRRIGYVFQRPSDNLIEYLTVVEHLRLAWEMRSPGHGAEVAELLDASALGRLAHMRPGQLSAGEQQRLAVAMAVAGRPDLVIADEPTAELDPPGAAALAKTFIHLAGLGQTFVVSSHDDQLISRAHQVLVIRHGVLAAVQRGTGPLLAVVDGGGRLQLPDEVLARLPDHLAQLTVGPGTVTITKP